MEKGKNVHPAFMECRNYTMDPYFQDILLCCARNKFPRGFRLIDEKTATISTNSGKEVYDLPLEDPCKLWKLLRVIFRDKLHLQSSSEFALNPDEIKNSILLTLSKLEGNSWTDIKSKKIKDQIILNFVVKKQKEHNLNTTIAKSLIEQLDLHMNTLKDITAEDINYNNGDIKDINGLSFEDENFCISCDNPPKAERGIPSRNQNAVEKYIKEIQTRQIYT